MRLMQENGIPAFRRLLIVHIRNGYGVKSFIEKCNRAASVKSVGYGAMQRGLMQRSKMNDGEYDPIAHEALLKTILLNKLGCGRLAHAFSCYFTTATYHMQLLGRIPA